MMRTGFTGKSAAHAVSAASTVANAAILLMSRFERVAIGQIVWPKRVSVNRSLTC